MSLTGKYQKSLAEQWSMCFKTRHPDGDNNYHGVVTHIKPKFIVVRAEWSFEFDGVIVLAKKFIGGVRDGKYEQCANQILRENGEIKKLRVPRWLDSCETVPQVLASLMRRDIWPGVEIVFNEGQDSAFYIGPVTRVDDERFSLDCYDAAGKWEKNYVLPYDEIFKIEFGDKYSRHFNAHMKSKKCA